MDTDTLNIMPHNNDANITYERALGRLEGRVESLDKRIQEIEGRIDKRITDMEIRMVEELKQQKVQIREVTDGIDEIKELVQQSRGGWKVIAAMGTVITFLAGAAVWLIDLLKAGVTQ